MKHLKWGLALHAGLICCRAGRADLVVGEIPGQGLPSIVQRFDESGNLDPAFSTPPLYESIEAVTVGPDGTVYAVQNTLGQPDIEAINPNTGAELLPGYGEVEDSTGALATFPLGLAVGPNGSLYVGSTPVSGEGVTNVFQVSPIPGQSTQYIQLKKGQTAPVAIGTIAFAPDGDLYFENALAGLDDSSNSTIQILDYNKVEKTLIPVITLAAGVIPLQGGMAFSPSGDLVLDTSAGIEEYTSGGTFIETLAPEGSGGLSEGGAIAFGSDGDLYAIDYGDNDILRYNATTGQFLGVYLTSADLGGSVPIDIAFIPEPTTLGLMAGGIALFLRPARKLA